MGQSGIVFDFNGTLFWDTSFQNSSWDEYLINHNVILTEEEKNEYIHGRNGKDTFEYIFKKKFSKQEIEVLTEEKEIYYRNECLKHTMELAPGVEKLLIDLIKNDIKIGIATASGRSNLDFFIEKFDLLRFFRIENIIYNDGSCRGKPHPDLFNKAIKSLGLRKEDIIIFEDSPSGIEAAIRAKVKDVVIVNSTRNNFSMYNFKVIDHFDAFDRTIINS